MNKTSKYEQILDALETLLKTRTMGDISVSEIAQTAGIGKGSIYYYFNSKDEILQALIERSYREPLRVAHHLAERTDLSAYVRMSMIFQACRNSSVEFLSEISKKRSDTMTPQTALLHQNYMSYLIRELKPELAAIIRQATENGDVTFDMPEELAEIALIVLTVKLANNIVPSTPEEISRTIQALIALIEKATDQQPGSMDYLNNWPIQS